MNFLFYFSIILFLLLAGILALVILVQESKSLGLGASFGGGDSSDSLFGTSTADILKKFTRSLAVLFIIGCVGLSLWSSSIGRVRQAVPPPVTIEEAP
ncbi:MAG: preprotein translocase subunit SecG [Simkaniaceae bacterium]